MSYSLQRRSPDLHVLDYAIWSEVEKQMRRQERNMKDSKHETRAQFEARLDRTANALPKDFIDRSIRIWQCELKGSTKPVVDCLRKVAAASGHVECDCFVARV